MVHIFDATSDRLDCLFTVGHSNEVESEEKHAWSRDRTGTTLDDRIGLIHDNRRRRHGKSGNNKGTDSSRRRSRSEAKPVKDVSSNLSGDLENHSGSKTLPMSATNPSSHDLSTGLSKLEIDYTLLDLPDSDSSFASECDRHDFPPPQISHDSNEPSPIGVESIQVANEPKTFVANGRVTFVTATHGLIGNEYFFDQKLLTGRSVACGDFVKFEAAFSEHFYVKWKCIWIEPYVSDKVSTHHPSEHKEKCVTEGEDQIVPCLTDEHSVEFNSGHGSKTLDIEFVGIQANVVDSVSELENQLFTIKVSSQDDTEGGIVKGQSMSCSWQKYSAVKLVGPGSKPICRIRSQHTKVQDLLSLDDIFCHQLFPKFHHATEISKSRLALMSDGSSLKQFIMHGYVKRDESPYALGSTLREFENIKACRDTLPIAKLKNDILATIKTTQTVVICGGTGCGKSTQVPNYILEDHERQRHPGCHPPCILVTQPRRISATSLATRVAAERNEGLGCSVGYCIRCDNVFPTSPRGSIVFCTPGMILRWMQLDPALSSFTHIVIDEIHERDVYSDILLILLKLLLLKRTKDLRVILMSATVNSERLATYFRAENGELPPIINIVQNRYTITNFYLEDVFEKLPTDFLKELRMRCNKETGQKQKRSKLKKVTVHDDDDAAAKKEAAYFDQYQKQLDKEFPETKKYRKDTLETLKVYDENVIDVQLVVAVIKLIMKTDTTGGGILVFVSGMDAIMEVLAQLESDDYFIEHRSECLTLPLHSTLSAYDQNRALEVPGKGIRKIVISTNIAETSLTIEDIVHVIDCGKMKVNHFNCTDNVDYLLVDWISQASATQRAGRAGRVRDGVCYHLFSRLRCESYLRPFIQSETERLRLENFCIQLIQLRLGPCIEFFQHALDPPPLPGLKLSLDELYCIGAIDEHEQLTGLGSLLNALPADVHCAKAVIYGSIFNCLKPMMIAAGTLDFRDIWDLKFGKINACCKSKTLFAGTTESDHWATFQAYSLWERRTLTAPSDAAIRCFCRQKGLSETKLRFLKHINAQFSKVIMSDMKLVTESQFHDVDLNHENPKLCASILYAAMFPKVAYFPPKDSEEAAALKDSGKYRHEPVGRLRPAVVASHSGSPDNLTEKDYKARGFKLKLDEQTVKCWNANRDPEDPDLPANANTPQYITFHNVMGMVGRKGREPGIYRAQDCSPVPPLGLVLFGGQLKSMWINNAYYLVVDEWAKFSCHEYIGQLLIRIRKLLDKSLHIYFAKHARCSIVMDKPNNCPTLGNRKFTPEQLDAMRSVFDIVIELFLTAKDTHGSSQA